MATYSNLSYGSSGDEVKKLQQSLINAGYDLGSTGADGQFGPKTQAAVKQYQQANGLAVDGIAGNNTQGKLYSTASGVSTKTAKMAKSPTTEPDYSKYRYDPSTNEELQKVLAALEELRNNTPTYVGTYDEQLEDLYQQIVNRDDFKYDINSDMLYNQYKDQYITLGSMAMKGTMGQAAALTGGYGSSYGQSVGQQQYDAYLQKLNDVVPELYGMAYDQYQQEGEDLLQQYGLLGDKADDEYKKYMDSLDQYWQEVMYLADQADSEYEKGYNDWRSSWEMGTAEEERRKAEEAAAYERLIYLMGASGYIPTDDELAAAGMTREQAENYIDGWKASNPDLAYRTGAITPEEYKKYTGEYPPGYKKSNTTYKPKDDDDDDDKGDDNPGTPQAGYNIGELADATAAGMTKEQIEEVLTNRGINVNDPGVQEDIRWALSK